MPDKLTDSEIVKAREVSLKEQIEHYNERKKEVFDSYYRRNTEGNEDTLEICVLRESAVLISKFESIINRLQAENERLKKANGLFEYLNKAVYFRSDIPFEFKTMEAKNNAINKYIDKMCNIQIAKAEAYKEFAERLKEKAKPHYFDNYDFAVSIDEIDNLLKEWVGEDNG